jgi:hypothetical protein
MNAPYWLIKCAGGYWLEAGGCTKHQRKAERFQTREQAQEDKRKWCDPREKAWLVKVLPSRKRALAAAKYFGAEYEVNPGSSRMEYMDDCAYYFGKTWKELSQEDKNAISVAFEKGRAEERALTGKKP